MSDKEKDSPQSENEDVESGVNDENEDTENEAEQKFRDQQKRAEKAEQERDKLKKKLQEVLSDDEEEEDTLPAKEEKQTSDVSRIRELTRLTADLDDDEYDALENTANELGVSVEKYVKSKAWKAQLGSIRDEQEAEATTPRPSRSSRGASKDSQLFKPGMSKDEHREAWRKIRG